MIFMIKNQIFMSNLFLINLILDKSCILKLMPKVLKQMAFL